MILSQVILISAALVFAVEAADVVILRCEVARGRNPNRKIEIRVEDSGKLTLKTESTRSEPATQEKNIDAVAIKKLRDSLAAINWEHVEGDLTVGRDGSTVELEYNGRKEEVWLPAYDSTRRRLTEFQLAVEQIYQLAGLTRDGIPHWFPRR